MITGDKCYFLDTNILLAATDELREGHDKIKSIIEAAHKGEIFLYVCGQIFREYLVVATRPRENNGFGLTPEEGVSNIRFFRTLTDFCPETEETSENLHHLIEQHSLKGKRIHDANIAAVMQSFNLANILTLKPRDFALFSHVQTVGLSDFPLS